MLGCICINFVAFGLSAGEPSLCYVHDGDGVCEPFERRSSILDCGLYTPKGYVDQWATQAFASHQDEKSCPVSVVTGEPIVKVRARYFLISVQSWGEFPNLT